MKNITNKLDHPERCVKLEHCEQKYLCNYGSFYHHDGTLIAKCPDYLSEQDAYELFCIGDDVR